VYEIETFLVETHVPIEIYYILCYDTRELADYVKIMVIVGNNYD